MTSLTVAVIPKIIALILLVCLTRAAAGSCLSYGHSCWGGHGKRSASIRHIFNPSNEKQSDDDWYISKLAKMFKERPAELPNVFMSRIRDSSTFEKLMRNAYRRYPFNEEAEAGRNHESTGDGSDFGERDSSENNSADAEPFLEPEDDSVWKKLRTYQKTGEYKRKGRAG